MMTGVLFVLELVNVGCIHESEMDNVKAFSIGSSLQGSMRKETIHHQLTTLNCSIVSTRNYNFATLSKYERILFVLFFLNNTIFYFQILSPSSVLYFL